MPDSLQQVKAKITSAEIKTNGYNEQRIRGQVKRYTTLYNQCEGEQEQLQSELGLEQAQYENDRKGSADTTQKIEIYFNFIGEYIPPTMAEKEPTLEELEEMRKKEARKDILHQNYLKRKAHGKQKEYKTINTAQKVMEMIEKVREREGRLDLPIVSVRKISDRTALQSADNAEKFIKTRKIDSFESLAKFTADKEQRC